MVIAVVSAAVALATIAGPDVVPVWAQASEITSPSGATVVAGAQDAGLSGVACTSPGNCVAVGSYADANGSGIDQLMAVNESDGSWGVAQKLTLPNDASTTFPQSAALYSVACTSLGNCVAVGQYQDTNGTADFLALYVTETDGVWGTAQTVSLPAGWNTTANGQDASLYGVTCTSAGNCVAVGTYLGTNGISDREAMVVTETNGAWAAATELALPTAGQEPAFLYGVTCTSVGNCTAVGDYYDAFGIPRAMVATETSGTWSALNEPVLPGNASTVPSTTHADLRAVSCTSPGNCVALGDYEDTSGYVHAMATVESQGSWAPATEVTLPGNASSTGYATFSAVTCTSPGDCVASGYYEDTDATLDYEAMFVDETRGVWGSASEVALPNPRAMIAAGGQFARVGAISCTSPGVCVSVVGYEDTNGSADDQALVVSSEPLLALATTGLPVAVVGSPYDTQLAATGGVGSYDWSLSQSSLPAGLSLNAATGLISGTPTAVGTQSVTVAASDPGPPVQTASGALAITVTGPGLVGVKIKSPKLVVTVSCGEAAGATCSGPLELTAVEHLTGGKLTAVSARKRPKRTTRTVLLASKTYAVAGGTSATVTLKLGQVGAKLLAKYRTIHAELTLDVGKITVTSEAVTIKHRATRAH